MTKPVNNLMTDGICRPSFCDRGEFISWMAPLHAMIKEAALFSVPYIGIDFFGFQSRPGLFFFIGKW